MDSSAGWAWTGRRRCLAWGVASGVASGSAVMAPRLVRALDPLGGRGQVERRSRCRRLRLLGVEPTVVLVDEHLEDDVGRVGHHGPRVVLVVVLTGQPLPDQRRLPTLAGQLGHDRARVVIAEEDASHTSIISLLWWNPCPRPTPSCPVSACAAPRRTATRSTSWPSGSVAAPVSTYSWQT